MLPSMRTWLLKVQVWTDSIFYRKLCMHALRRPSEEEGNTGCCAGPTSIRVPCLFAFPAEVDRSTGLSVAPSDGYWGTISGAFPWSQEAIASCLVLAYFAIHEPLVGSGTCGYSGKGLYGMMPTKGFPGFTGCLARIATKSARLPAPDYPNWVAPVHKEIEKIRTLLLSLRWSSQCNTIEYPRHGFLHRILWTGLDQYARVSTKI